MATHLTGDSSLKRTIRVAGIETPINMEITSTGIEFWAKGSRKRVTTGWTQIISSGYTGQDVPSYLAGKPFELLKHFSERR